MLLAKIRKNSNSPETCAKSERGRKNERRRSKDSFFSFRIILSAFIFALVLNVCFIVNAVVPSGSMEPAIPSGQAVIGWRLAYIQKAPKRGDIVIFRHEESDRKLLKRIAAVQGDTVEVRSDGVWINDLLYAECTAQSTDEIKTYQVPEGSYFLIGDNFDNSFDSRNWEYPYVSREEIIARVIFGYFPKMYIIE
ncbi:MAG: signal peptidase I [Ruminococcaceae bacterium]|nr:signal peptidase I [Oscillospiraceae bacterium]